MHGNHISSQSLRKARLDALNAKTFLPCLSCTVYGHRCSISRPCSKCVKNSRSCIRAPEKRRPRIEHPLICTSTHILINCEDMQESTINVMCHLEWASAALSRQRRIGFRVDSIIHSLSSVTAKHHYAISESLAAARIHAPAFSYPSRPDIIVAAPRFELQFEHKLDSTVNFEQFMADGAIGFVSVTFEPATGRRRSIVANQQMVRPLIIFKHHDKSYHLIRSSGISVHKPIHISCTSRPPTPFVRASMGGRRCCS